MRVWPSFRVAVAGYFGYAAHDIRISGLKWHSPPAVLDAIGVTPGGPLVGFEPARARRLLENLDWVKSARVHRLFPNQLEIHIVERQPFAIWQRDGRFHVIDDAGVALSSIMRPMCRACRWSPARAPRARWHNSLTIWKPIRA
jgi:cell division protein FtsQ